MAHPDELFYKNVKIKFLGFLNLEPIKTLSIGLMGFFVSYIWALKKYKENDAPVFVVYNMGATHFQIPFLVLASKLSGAKIISVITDLDAANECDSLRDCFKYVWWRIQSNCVKCLDAVVVLNDNVISDLKYRKPNLHLKGIIPSDEFVGKVSKLKIISSKSNFRLLYMGSLNELRGIKLLIEAFALMEDTGIELWITGRGELQSYVEQVAKLNSRIKYKGFLENQDDLLPLIESATLLVNPHLIDKDAARYVFPSKLTEYMASGRPVLSTNQGGIKRFYEPYVYIADEATPESMASSILKIKEMPLDELVPRVEKARAFVLKNKLWNVQGETVANFIREAVL